MNQDPPTKSEYEWQKEAVKSYFRSRTSIKVDTVDLLGYFHIVSCLSAADELYREGWLAKTSHPVYPKYYQVGD